MGKIQQIIIGLEDDDELSYDASDNPILDNLWELWEVQSHAAQKLEEDCGE